MSTPKKRQAPNTPKRTLELVVEVNQLTPKDLMQCKAQESRLENISPKEQRKFVGGTPKRSKKQKFLQPSTPATDEFALELKKAINERNLFTSKTRKRVFEALDELDTKREEETRKFKRENSLLEIVSSELKYVFQLECIIKYFMNPISEKKLLKSDEFEVLFGSIKTIYNVNKQLIEELDKGCRNVGTAFSNIAPFFKLYAIYAYGFKDKLRILENSRITNSAFSKFVESQESRPEVQSKLSALLITPIQRVPRYRLLLQQLYDLTKPLDPDYELLGECLDKIKEVATHINKIVADQENNQRLLELQRCLQSGEPNIIVPGRQLKKEGTLMKMSSKNAHSQKLYVVLMSDIVMFNRLKKDELKVNSLKCSGIFPLNKCQIIEVLDKGCFKIVCQNEQIILYHEQLQETKNWIDAIKLALDTYLEDRKTLRKESSARRAVKRKDVNEYNEVGLSPGQPLKKKKRVMDSPPTLKTQISRKIAGRKSVRSMSAAVNSTPIKLTSNPETAEIVGFSTLQTTFSNNDTHLEIQPQSQVPCANDTVFHFGRRHEEHNSSKIGTFFRSFGSSIKSFLGFDNKN